MGVKGLCTFLKRWDTVTTITEAVKGKRIAIDLFWFLHRTKGNFLKLQASLEPFLTANKVYVMVDGTETTAERRAELDRRQEQRDEKRIILEEIQRTMQVSREELGEVSCQLLERYHAELQHQLWTPSPEYIERILIELRPYSHVTILQVKGEADDALAMIEQQGQVDLVVSNDSDLIVQGVNRLLRVNTNLDGSGRIFCKQIVIHKMRFTEQQWDDFLWLLKHMKSTDILLAFSLISVYRGRDRAMMRWREMHGVELV